MEGKEFFSQLYITRLAIMLETAPQSGQYRQILLNAQQFKNFSDALVLILSGAAFSPSFVAILHNKVVVLPDELQDFYTQEYINKHIK